jgi:hypothetical protein
MSFLTRLYGILLIFLAIDISITGTFMPYWGYDIELGIIKFPISILLLYFGVKQFLVKNRIKIIEFSKCPKCKETYAYSELKNGMCPKCEVETIDIEKYFKKFPKI